MSYGGGPRKSRVAYGWEKWRTTMELRLPWAPHIAALACAVATLARGPALDSTHKADRLTDFFVAADAAFVAIALALFLLERKGDGARLVRFVGFGTVAYLVVGLAAASAALLPLSDEAVRWLFAAVLACGAAVLVTLGLVGVANVRSLRVGTEADLLAGLSKPHARKRRRRR